MCLEPCSVEQEATIEDNDIDGYICFIESLKLFQDGISNLGLDVERNFPFDGILEALFDGTIDNVDWSYS